MTREEALKKRQGGRLRQARAGAGYRSAREAALANEWPESTYRAHEGGTRTIGQDDAERYAKRYRAEGVHVTAQSILFDDLPKEGEDERPRTTIPLGGYVGAGGRIDTSTEQREPGVEYEVALTTIVPDATVAYQVIGESMLPVFEPNMVIVCRAHTTDPELHLGKRVVVGTSDGARLLKKLAEGTEPGRYNLESSNAETIRNVELAWVAHICAYIPADEWQLLEKNGGSAVFKKNNPKRTT
jgi:phage repressor protein C with HTH and peptisase S24 domain